MLKQASGKEILLRRYAKREATRRGYIKKLLCLVHGCPKLTDGLKPGAVDQMLTEDASRGRVAWALKLLKMGKTEEFRLSIRNWWEDYRRKRGDDLG